MKRADILQTAEKCVCGQREQDYGKPENNFQAIADLWNAYMKNVRGKPSFRLEQPTFTSFDVAMLMALLKVGRIATGTATEDSFVDACGYLACGGEIAGKTNPIEREEQRKVLEALDALAEAKKGKDNVDWDNRDPGSGAKQY